MFTSSCSRIAHGSDSSSEGPPSPCRSGGFPLRRKFHLSFLRFRISSLLRLFRSLRLSCRRALQAALMPKKPKKKSPACKPRMGMAFSTQCTRSACAPDAIADCIEFIKRSSSSCSSSSSSSLSSPSLSGRSSPSLSSHSSPSLSSRLLPQNSQHKLSPFFPSRLHHYSSQDDNSFSSPLSRTSTFSLSSPCH